MVGPSRAMHRRGDRRRLAAGFVGFVGVSAALTALGSGATPGQTGLIGLGGAAVGLGLLAILR